MTKARHHKECLAQQANTLFGEAGPCVCPKGWPRRPRQARKGAATPKVKRTPKEPNPCLGATVLEQEVPVEHWSVTFPFTPSTKQLTDYALHKRHHIPQTRDFDDDTGEIKSKNTFDDEAIRQLKRQYPKDALYSYVEQYRVLQKAGGTYVSKLKGGDLLGADGRIHDQYRHSPKTLRLAMEMLQVLPRPVPDLEWKDMRRMYNRIRECFVPSEGRMFAAVDFANIEPLLVAYCARDSVFLRACRTSSHSWFAAHVIGKTVDFSKSDEEIKDFYKELAAGGPYEVGTGRNKASLPWKVIRDACKVAGMTSLYAGGPTEIARANPEVFATRNVAKYYQDAFFDLAPKVQSWHWAQAEMVEKQGYLLAPSGFRLHYAEPFTYAKGANGLWQRELSLVAKKAIASVPQHTGAMYLFTAFLAFCREYREMADDTRLLIHDEIFGEPLIEQAQEWEDTLISVMERPHPKMPLDWCSPEERAVMGDYLSVKAEGKRSKDSWGRMTDKPETELRGWGKVTTYTTNDDGVAWPFVDNPLYEAFTSISVAS